MTSKRSFFAKRNFAYGVINKTVSVFLPFLIRVIMIRRIGADYLGLDSLFISILQVLNLSELGFSQAVMYSMYKPIADDDIEALCAIYAYYRKVYRIVGCVILGVGTLLLPFIPNMIAGSYPSVINIHILYLIHLFNTAVSYLFFAYKQTLLSAYQRQDLVSNINSVARLMMYLLQVIVLITTGNYYLYTIMMLLMTAVMNVGASIIADRLFPNIVCRGSINEELRVDIITRVKGIMVSKLCATSRNAFDSIMISAFVGLTVTAMYGNYYYVIHAVNGLFAVISMAIAASVGNSIASESKEKNYVDMKHLTFIYMWLSGIATACMLCLYQSFIRISFGDALLFSTDIMFMFVVYFYCLKLGDIFTVFYQGAGLWWKGRYRAIAESIANLVLNFVLGKLLGVYGIIIATLLSLFVINFLWGSNIIFKHYFTQTTSAEYFKLHGFYAVVTLAACLVTYFITESSVAALGLDGIPAMALILGICIVVPNIIYMAVYRRTRIYKESISWLGRVTGWEQYGWWKVFGIET